MVESTKSCEQIAEAVVWLKVLSLMLYRAGTSEDDVTRTGYLTDWQTAMSNLSSGCIMYQDTKFRSLWDVETE
jgi:hypothetical protein